MVWALSMIRNFHDFALEYALETFSFALSSQHSIQSLTSEGEYFLSNQKVNHAFTSKTVFPSEHPSIYHTTLW